MNGKSGLTKKFVCRIAQSIILLLGLMFLTTHFTTGPLHRHHVRMVFFQYGFVLEILGELLIDRETNRSLVKQIVLMYNAIEENKNKDLNDRHKEEGQEELYITKGDSFLPK